MSRSSVPVTVGDLPDERFSAAVEATAYFTIAEAITNAARHADAKRVNVEATLADGWLRVEVRDDGQEAQTRIREPACAGWRIALLRSRAASRSQAPLAPARVLARRFHARRDR